MRQLRPAVQGNGAVFGGLMDEVCPPSTVYGAFNAYDGEKTIVQYEFNNHEGGQGYQEREQMAWLSGLFGVG
ncbi:acetylxylan esterase [Mesorhizobium sp. WSM3864]|uniref:acetylxylan esterase n=1 Tax=Mesorhizobium sp. WSM3864 TaxID=2029404 RepID=UPI001FE18D68|nr:acetylxylan esterase [Mesorhizobium sp. WSM3864]